MDSRQLHYFRAIVDSGSFTAAAEKLLMAQPSLSTTIKNLEKELGTTLLIRSRTGVSLTEPGREIYRLAVEIQEQMEFSAARVKGFATGEVGQVVMSVAPTFNWEVLPQLVRDIRNEAPGIDFVLEDPDPATTLSNVRTGQADIGIIPTSDIHGLRALNPDLTLQPISEVDLVLALPTEPAELPSGDEQVSLAAVTDRVWFIPRHRPELPGLPEALERFWRKNPQARPRRIHHVATILTALPLVSGGSGITLIPRSLATSVQNRITIRQVTDPIPPLILVAVWHPTRYQPPAVGRVLHKILSGHQQTDDTVAD